MPLTKSESLVFPSAQKPAVFLTQDGIAVLVVPSFLVSGILITFCLIKY